MAKKNDMHRERWLKREGSRNERLSGIVDGFMGFAEPLFPSGSGSFAYLDEVGNSRTSIRAEIQQSGERRTKAEKKADAKRRRIDRNKARVREQRLAKERQGMGWGDF